MFERMMYVAITTLLMALMVIGGAVMYTITPFIGIVTIVSAIIGCVSTLVFLAYDWGREDLYKRLREE